MNERARKQDLKRAAILDAAGAVFAERGFAAATTLHIASAAHVSKRDIYALFGSKEGVLHAVVRRGMDSMAAPITPGPAVTRAEFLATLRDFAEAFLARLLDPAMLALYRLAIAEAPQSPELGRTLGETATGAVNEAVRVYVLAAQEASLVDFPDPGLALAAFFGVLLGGLQLRVLLNPAQSLPPETIRNRASRAMAVLAELDRNK
jgi:AcrR family transcriptional regulator